MKHLRLLFFNTLILLVVMLSSTTVHAAVKKINVSVTSGSDLAKPLQSALNEALTDTSGKTTYDITVPAGSYSCSALLKVFSNTSLHLNGVKITRKNDATMVRFGYVTDKNTGYNGVHDILIEGGCFDGNAPAKKIKASLIRLGHGKNITFQNVTFQNVTDSHHIELAACSNVLFKNCTFKNFYSTKTATNTGNVEALQLDIIQKDHFPHYPVFDDTPCNNITVTGCTFENLQRGLGTHSGIAGSYFTNITFTNNVFRNILGYAIIATNYADSDISDNVIDRCGAGILFRSMNLGNINYYAPLSGNPKIVNDANSTIQRNTIYVVDKKFKNTAYGISLYGEVVKAKTNDVPAGDYSLENVTVQNNKITMKNSGYGIWLQKANKCLIHNNKVTMNISSKVSGKGNSDCIRSVGSTKTIISNNNLIQKKSNKKTESACGIVATERSNLTIKNNKIQNSPKDGIYVNTKSKATITKNTIRKAGRYGLNVSDRSTVTSRKNKISKCKRSKTNTWDGGKIK